MSHLCHWPGCGREVPPSMWGCKSCWERLPKFIRDAIWKWYVHGQEVRKDPSEQYIKVARITQLWCEASTVTLEDGTTPRGLTPMELMEINAAFRVQLRDAGLL